MVTRHRAFYSLHYDRDAWRASMVRQMGVIAGNPPVIYNDWEQVKRGGDRAIRQWINSQMGNRSCVVVLIGTHTSGRKWINYEIKRAWKEGKGLLGVYIHNLRDARQQKSAKGANPYYNVIVDGHRLSRAVPAYEPVDNWRTSAYRCIEGNLASWVAQAVADRAGRFKV